ncbi:MAG: MTH1187 family thiamine-binding protein [Gallicola sp.]|nr:MTH1187 family thiamine-binding protein [Gallicola sp.]
MVVAELTLIPIGTKKTSVSSYIAKGVRVLKSYDIEYEVTPMGTIISCENLGRLYEILEKMQESIFDEEVRRVYSVIKIDDRRDTHRNFKEKVNSVLEKL